MNDWEELAKNLAVPIGMILLWIYIALTLVGLPFPLNYIFGVFLPIVASSAAAWHYYKKRAQWELDDKIFPNAERLAQISEELKAKAKKRMKA